MLELLKVLVQPVLLERDADGVIVGERVGEPTALYDENQLPEFWAAVQAEIVRANGENGRVVVPEIVVPS